MHGQQISAQRRLNRHWQSARRKPRVLSEIIIHNYYNDPTSPGDYAYFSLENVRRIMIKAEVIENHTSGTPFLWACGYSGGGVTGNLFTAYDASNPLKVTWAGGTSLTPTERQDLENNGYTVMDYMNPYHYTVHLPLSVDVPRWGTNANWQSPIIDVSQYSSSLGNNFYIRASTDAYPDLNNEYGVFRVRIQILAV